MTAAKCISTASAVLTRRFPPGLSRMGFAAVFFLAGGLGTPAFAQSPPAIAGDAVRGAKLYEARCEACHSIDHSRIGPSHRGVVGRASAAVKDFTYTPALKKLKVTWTPANLDRWLASPPKMAKGTSMGINVPVAKDRTDIIAYLATQTDPTAAAAKPAAPATPTKK